MMDKAVLVNNNFILCTEHEEIYKNDFNVTCNAIDMIFINVGRPEVEGGTVFVYGCPALQEAGMLITAKVAKIVTNREPENSDELAARVLLIDNGIDYEINSEIVL